MPADSGMAFVLIPHLDPTHDSLMVELLGRQTTMTVQEVRDGMAVQPNQVYVIPPNADMTIRNRVLHLAPPPPRGRSHTAIDAFLLSLADDQAAEAMAIVLSGTGSHGTAGALAIKAAGGLVLAQTPESAEQDQMPRSAVTANAVDRVLPPEQMAQALIDHLARPAARAQASPDALGAILTLLRAQMKRDFGGYRQNMVLRRVKRRMGLCRVGDMAAYAEYLRAHPDEVQALGKDLSISVTAFFREPDAFQILERVVIPELVARSGRAGDNDRPIRVWVPGCATGEEAYSIAILFLEQLAAAGTPVALQIFATDVDDEALDVARAGLFPATIATDVSPERLRHFFVKSDGHYQVTTALRDTISFATQNLVSDPPFSRLDLVSCRNVLIYLEPGVQEKVIALFHFALVDGGYLLLGPAESIGSATERFDAVSKKWRVFRRTGSRQRRPPVDIPILPVEAHRAHPPRRDERPRSSASAPDRLQRTLLSDFAPAAVLIDQRHQIRSVQGPVVDYLEFPPGELTRNLLAMARPGLRPAIRSVCEEAVQSHHPATEAHARVRRQGVYLPCIVTARPAPGSPDEEEMLVVTFQEQGPPRADTTRKPARPSTRRRTDESMHVRQLEHELTATREDLQGTIDELKTANEELKAWHEEVMSMNEELQSTNEEMETSKEELQSLNEELSTVNSQLQEKVHELDTANNDMVNLLASTDIATVFLDAELRIKRFTSPTARLLNLLASDIGRPFRDIAPRVNDPTLLEDCARVVEKLAPLETVAGADDGLAYLRRVLPYRTADSRITGVVITWVDITRRLAAEAESRHLSAVLRDSSDAVILFDLDGHITGWNRGAERLYGYTEAHARTMNVRDLLPEPHREAMSELIRRLRRGETVSESVESERIGRDGQVHDVWVTVTLLRDAAGRPDALVSTERDVTGLKEGVVARQAARLYQQMIEQLPAGAVLREDGRLMLNGAAEAMTGFQRAELSSVEAWCAALHGSNADTIRPRYEMTIAPGQLVEPMAFEITRKDGHVRHITITPCRLDATRELWVLLDVTERDRAESALRLSQGYLQAILATAADAIITIDDRGTIETFNPSAERLFGFTAAEVLGENVNILMPSPHRDEHDEYLARYLRTGEPHIIGAGREVVGQRKDGTTFPVDLAVSQIDHLRHFTGVLRDLTDRRQLEWRLAESQVEERRHMARELHDEIGGHMTGIGLLAQTLEGQLVRLGSPLAPQSKELAHSIRDAHQRLRAVIRGLMPVDAIPEGLQAALDRLAIQSESSTGISCRFQCDPPVRVETPFMALQLYRIAHEAVNNAIRHSQASHITITLRETDRRLELAIVDDGRGIGTVAAGHGGIGLESMRQRGHLLGGECAIQPRDGGGTLVRCWLPKPPAAPPLTDAPR